ncbi:glycosyltransferase family 2 protein [Anaerocolumna sp. AGMB13020]|uniref:glycosyltransferase family 2 protein n=1 Tax=Anaerocolumna sp. AGMB13020 TaxID=3081750 RepID=UPI002953AB39|nr:glycosyltransferase family 2 protein [Anaerocolumna sp. AGMB13020]WOO35450.1 glycosyltransferase family 2 protein [Anaerocolumna sp. AGMB13020]
MIDTKTDFFKTKNNFQKYKGVESECILSYKSEKNPFITVVIPTYKRVDTLKLSINSVLNQNNIENINYEILVIDNDNNFESETELLIKSYKQLPIRYYKNMENIGQVGNWNRGIELSRSEWIVLLHDDDLLEPNYFVEIIKLLTLNKNIQGLGTIYKLFNHDSEILHTDTWDLNYNKKNSLVKKNKVKGIIKNILLIIRKSRKKLGRGKLYKLKLIDYYFECGYNAPIGTLYKKSNVIELGGFDDQFFPISDQVFHINYLLTYGFYIFSLELSLRGIGFNEALLKKWRIGFIENGYFLRKAIKNKLKIHFWGEWWIQIDLLYQARVNYDLEMSDIRRNFLNIKYDKPFYKFLYLLIYRSYNLIKKY